MNDPAYWRRAFRRHDHITQRIPRTTAELDNDPHSWWQPPEPRGRAWVDRAIEAVCWVLSIVLLGSLFVLWAGMSS